MHEKSLRITRTNGENIIQNLLTLRRDLLEFCVYIANFWLQLSQLLSDEQQSHFNPLSIESTQAVEIFNLQSLNK